MNNKRSLSGIFNFINHTDWKLLVFLLLFLNVKLIFKATAILFIYLLRFNFKFGFRFKNSRLPLFYLIIPAIAILNYLIFKGYQNLNYNIAFLTGILFWLACILAIHQLKWSVENKSAETIHNTLLAFFIINALASFLNLAAIIWETGAINPYRYQGNYQKYFIGTGDYIKGITFDTSTTNAIINAFGVIYFFVRKNIIMILVSMIVLLLTASNFSNVLLLITFVYLFIFRSDRDQKSLLVVCCMCLATFMIRVSPQNNQYITETYRKLFDKPNDKIPIVKNIPITEMPESELTAEERKQRIAMLYLDSLVKKTWQKKYFAAVSTEMAPDVKPKIPGADIHSKPYQRRTGTNDSQAEILDFIQNNAADLPMQNDLISDKKWPGKIIALQQTCKFFHQHPAKIFIGTGTGNFSSKLAFRTTSLNIAGSYAGKYTYINQDFKLNHLGLYLYFFSQDAKSHSLMNSPHSAYDQLLSEYGLLGILSFFLFYVAFFIKHRKKLTYGIPLLILLLGVFFVEYWFEQLSVVILFELLMLLNIKECQLEQFQGNETK